VKNNNFYSEAEKQFRSYCDSHDIFIYYNRFDGITSYYTVLCNANELKGFILLCENQKIDLKNLCDFDSIHVFGVKIERHFYDNYERKIVNSCIANKEPFTFQRDVNGYHHYSFGNQECSIECIVKSIDELQTSELKPKVVIKKGFLNKLKYLLQNFKENNHKKKEWKEFLNSLGYSNLKELRLLFNKIMVK
jgi:hypothetical protein